MNVDLLIVVHALLGFIAISSLILIIVRTKGDLFHKLLGYALVVASIGLALAGSIAAINVDKLYFINIGIATLCQITLGLLVFGNKHFRVRRKELLVLTVFSVNSLLFFSYDNTIAYSLGVVYGIISSYQWYVFFGPKVITKRFWLAHHIGHMLGAGISLITAFIVGNVGNYATIGFTWVIPAILGIWLVRYFRLKYAPDRSVVIGKFKW